MLTRQEGERLAQAVHSLRPDWPIPSLVTFISKRWQRPYLDLSLELVYVAQLPDTKNPARIDQDGPWKRLQHSARPVAQIRASSPTDCDICGRGRHLHPAPNDDHEWIPFGRRGEPVMPTDEQRALIEAEKAKAAALVSKNRDKPKREVKSIDEVLQRHQPNTQGEPK